MTTDLLSIPVITSGALNGLNHVRHAFFTRQGGDSRGVFDSLNCGLGSNDAPENVRANRARAMQRLGTTEDRLATLRQTHGARALIIEAPWGGRRPGEADALVTGRPELVIGVLTADCAPVILADDSVPVIGIAHAGWRGALGGILQSTVQSMLALGAEVDNIRAVIGPCIAQRSYEVSQEFPRPFLAQERSNSQWFAPAPRPGHLLFNLAGYVGNQLGQAGVRCVSRLPYDTCSESKRFFSYRRACRQGDGDYGRNLSAVLIGS